MKALEIHQMEQIEGGSCGGAVAISGASLAAGSALLVAGVATGGAAWLLAAGYAVSRAAAVASIINGCA